MYKVSRYTAEDKIEWDRFIATAKNATFLFQRDFMDYHQDRFEDFSLMIYKNEKLYALLPANKKNEVVYSHEGLTYGGLLLNNSAKLKQTFDAFKEINKISIRKRNSKIRGAINPSLL